MVGAPARSWRRFAPWPRQWPLAPVNLFLVPLLTSTMTCERNLNLVPGQDSLPDYEPATPARAGVLALRALDLARAPVIGTFIWFVGSPARAGVLALRALDRGQDPGEPFFSSSIDKRQKIRTWLGA